MTATKCTPNLLHYNSIKISEDKRRECLYTSTYHSDIVELPLVNVRLVIISEHQ